MSIAKAVAVHVAATVGGTIVAVCTTCERGFVHDEHMSKARTDSSSHRDEPVLDHRALSRVELVDCRAFVFGGVERRCIRLTQGQARDITRYSLLPARLSPT